MSTLRYALRRLARRPGTTALHVGGLAVGLASCFLAGLYVQDELAYDRFHESAETVIDVREAVRLGDQTMRFRTLPEGGAEALRERTAGVEAVAQTDAQAGLVRTGPGAEGVEAEHVRFADGAFLDVFSFPLTHGDARTALSGPDRAVLSRDLALALYGTTDALGRTVTIERTGFGLQDPEPLALTVTGVASAPPGPTSVPFDVLVSGQTRLATFDGTEPAVNPTTGAYVRLASIADTVAVQASLAAVGGGEGGHFGDFGEPLGVQTPRLVDAHLSGERWSMDGGLAGKPFALGLFGAVAALVLLLACVNYANLATALAADRSAEVGVRKAVGAGRGQLAAGFLAETALLALAAGALAVAVTALALPAFNGYFGKAVALAAVPGWALAAALGLVAATALLAGLYPAAVLARFRPVAALRGRAGAGGVGLRRALVVFQFAVTAVLLGATAVIFGQLSAARQADLGFEGDRVAVLDLSATRLGQASDRLEQEVEALPGVARASLTSYTPGGSMMMTTVSPNGEADARPLNVTAVQADTDYPATLGLRLAAGGWFPDGTAYGTAVVVNETAARQLGIMTTDPAEAVGRSVAFGGAEAPTEVVGVLHDFRTDGPRREISPLVAQPLTEFHNALVLAVQFTSADARALDDVRDVWERVVPEYPFAPTFVDDAFADLVREDRQLGQLFALFGGVAVILACLGVFGLAAHAAERRRKEVGVRRVLGASVAGIVARLSAEFAALVAVALAVAVPVVIAAARWWLDGFAYAPPLSPLPLVLVGLGVLALALLAAGVHAVRAATADPVHALRSE